MSTPQNPLAKFRSYSFYHVLALCDRTATAIALSQSTKLSAWQHPDGVSDSELGIYRPIEIPVQLDFSNPYVQDDGAIGRYCILINGSTDANFVITEARWQAITAGEAVQGDNGTSCAFEGTLKVVEPRGILFSDQIIACSLAMTEHPVNVVWVLKTFFVGYEQDGTVTYISDVTPLFCTVSELVGTFTEAGGVYELSFFGASLGEARLPQYSKVVEDLSVFLGSGDKDAPNNTLQIAMKKLQGNVEANYARYATCIRSYVQDAFKNNPVEQATQLSRYYDVAYSIGLDPEYQTDKYKVTDDLPQYKNKLDCNQAGVFKPAPGMSIESAIAQIMSMCPQVKADMSRGAEDGRKYEYKILPGVISTSQGGQKKVLVHYQIRRFPVPKNAVLEIDSSTTPSNTAPQEGQKTSKKDKGQNITTLVNENKVEFDYIYSGKNIDVLEFDIKMNLGLAYLQSAVTHNSLKQQLETMYKRSIQISLPVDNPSKTLKNIRTNIPIFFGTIVSDYTINDSDNHKTSMDAAYTLSKHASLEVADSTIKITGNPNILGSLNKGSSPGILLPPTPVHSDLEFDPAAIAFPHFFNIPAYVKLNIFMPTTDDDLTNFQQKSNYTQRFWYEGYYNVYGIDNEFVDGVFTQTLKMLVLPDISVLEEEDAKEQTGNQEQEFETQFKNCYEGTATPTTPTSAAAVTGSSSTNNNASVPVSKAEAKDVQARTNSPHKVLSFNEADPKLQSAIIAAAAKNPPVTAALLAQFCQVESNFGTQNIPLNKKGLPASTARGPYQFIEDTWLKIAKPMGGAKIGVNTTGKTDEEILALRTNPDASSLGAAALMSENITILHTTDPGLLYAAHVFGPTRAKKIYDTAASKPNATLSSAVGLSAADEILTANEQALLGPPGINNGNEPTVSQLVKWTRVTKMGGSSTEGVITVPPQKQITAQTSSPPSQTLTQTGHQGVSARESVGMIRGATPPDKQNNNCDKNVIVTTTPSGTTITTTTTSIGKTISFT